jgi:putative transposase
VDIYAESFHRGLKGIPARRWEEALAKGFFPRVPNSAKELKITLGRVMYRSIQPGGIDFHSLRYNSDKLGPLRGRMLKRKRRGENHYVKVKYNPSNISYLYVLDPDEEKYLAVPALAQNYTQGLSLWKHKVIHNYVLSKQDKVDIEALAEARRELQKIVEAGMKRKKKRTRVKAARWQYGGSQTDGSGVVQEAAENETLLTSAPDIDLDDLQDEGWDVSHNLLDTWEVYDEY